MSEELLQTNSVTIGRYVYYKLGATTLSQLRSASIVRGKFSPELATRKPDGLIVLPGGDVKAVIEYKQAAELQTASGIKRAIEQELEVAKQLCKLLIVTSNNKTIWVNALNGRRILTEAGHELVEKFDAKELAGLSYEQRADFEELLDKIDYSLTSENDQLEQPSVVNPASLARSMWQTIWINTGKEPEKCLYNVVELFVFKFLSDVGVLKAHNNFQSVFRLKEPNSSADALKHYALICRREINALFPKGEDGTTIINGTIFVNERGEPNISQHRLFGEVLSQLQEYDSQHGSFKYIKKDFKTRLYESFLRQSAGVRFLGQYFTPRNVVQAMVVMSNAAELRAGARICDPFCGVGGFILETIAANPHIMHEFVPVNRKVAPKITLLGYDKGTDEKEDERTIILAKANMLIYFSDLLAKYNSRDHLKAFSEGAFNRVFHLIRSNIGTFEKVHEEAFDLILTNPPYVTGGSSSLKKEIEEQGLGEYYTSGGRGTEALALEWIIRHLKPGGQALIVVPDGLLNQTNAIKYVVQECIVQGIISLPKRTFYSTPKKTYILILRRKMSHKEEQTDPVFTYLVSEIGESRDARRLEIKTNDLDDATLTFNQFKVSPKNFISNHPRCKLIPFNIFYERSHWMVDRWWTAEEKIASGIDEDEEMSEVVFVESVKRIEELLNSLLSEYQDGYEGTSLLTDLSTYTSREISLADTDCFSLFIGKRVLKKDVGNSGVPLFSANVEKPFGFVQFSNIADFVQPSLLWGIDGIFNWSYVPKDKFFATTDHCGVLRVKHALLDPKYVYYALKMTKDQYGFDRTYRASLKNLKNDVSVVVPLLPSGEFDLKIQRELAAKYEKFDILKQTAISQMRSLITWQV